ncbi:transporter [Paenisporosarcina indica]|uniref:transporter n=1 Tax=Paenisporosarcina indica TaxID=650093 RepID=UPI00094F54DE|nr:transporter [Paenisporosarcina indica]
MVNQLFPFQPGDDRPGFGNPNFPGQGGPGFGNPNFPGQGRPPGSPGQGGQGRPSGSSGPPSGPPPSFTPQQSAGARGGVGAFAVDPGAIRGCLFRFTFVWLRNGRSFWLFPTFVGRESVAGWRWNGFRWSYYGTDLNRISSFQCF